jgi:hypothetical protein
MVLATIWEFLKKIPGWVWLVVAGVLVGFSYVQSEKARVRRETNDKRDRESAEAEREIITNITETTNEAIRQSDGVRSIPAARELPDGTATLEEYHYRDQRRGVERGPVRNGQGDPDIS